MSKALYTLIPTPNFTKELKALSKKYSSIIEDVELLATKLVLDPTHTGTSLGGNFYKIRIAIKSKSQGKSGGARVIINVMVIDKAVGLISIYDKSEQGSVSVSELKEILKTIKHK